MNILVIGASGFIGSQLVDTLVKSSHSVYAVIRNLKKDVFFHDAINVIEVGDFSKVEKDFWLRIFKGMDVIIDCSGKTPEKKQLISDIELCNNIVNNITLAAKESKISHYIFLSSIKVLGDFTNIKPFNSFSIENPTDIYAHSKYEAEQKIVQNFDKTNTNYSILRPSLVIGPGLKGNILSLIKVIDKVPILPLKNRTYRKSVVGLNNLLSFIEMTIKNPFLYNKKIPISDENISIYDMSLKISKALNKKRYFFALPEFFMFLLKKLSSRFARLFSSLEVDSSFIKDNLKYSPIVSIEQEIKKMVDLYKK